MTWLLLIVGLIGVPVFGLQLRSGLMTGVTRGTSFDVSRAENPFVFRMAMVLNAMFLVASVWFVVEAISRIAA